MPNQDGLKEIVYQLHTRACACAIKDVHMPPHAHDQATLFPCAREHPYMHVHSQHACGPCIHTHEGRLMPIPTSPLHSTARMPTKEGSTTVPCFTRPTQRREPSRYRREQDINEIAAAMRYLAHPTPAASPRSALENSTPPLTLVAGT